MQKKKVNILIVGCGKMGSSHIKSFLDKSCCNLLLYDNDKTKLKNYESLKNIEILKNIKLKKRIKLCILSTPSKTRFNLFKKLYRQKKIEIFLLEKFMFLKKKNYDYVKQNYKINKIFNNVWGKYLFKLSQNYNLKFYDKVEIKIQKGHMLTNLIHFMNFFSYYQKFIKLNKFELQPFNKAQYDEYSGKIYLEYSLQKVKIQTSKIKNIFEISFSKSRNKKKFKIILKKNLKLYFFLNKNVSNVLEFPLASFFSYKFFIKNNLVPNFREILNDNLNVISITKGFNNKKKIINIR